MRKIVATEKAPAALDLMHRQISLETWYLHQGRSRWTLPQAILWRAVSEAQTRQVFANIKAVLEEAGSGLDKIVKTTCFLQNMDDFATVNEIYGSYFDGDYPSRSAFEVAKLPKALLSR